MTETIGRTYLLEHKDIERLKRLAGDDKRSLSAQIRWLIEQEWQRRSNEHSGPIVTTLEIVDNCEATP